MLLLLGVQTSNGFDGFLGGTTAVENTDPLWVNDCCYKKPVLTAIIDGGMQYDHPDVFNKIWNNTAENPDNMDEKTRISTHLLYVKNKLYIKKQNLR